MKITPITYDFCLHRKENENLYRKSSKSNPLKYAPQA